MVLIRCNNSKKHNTGAPHIWEYTGGSLVSAQCSKCKNSVTIHLNKVEMDKNG